MTTSGGVPIGNKLASLTIGPRGPILLQDHVYLDETAHFDRERIPERVVHAKGSGMKFLIILKSVKSTSFTFLCTGAFGYFEVTHDITKYCKAAVFSQVGKKTPVAVRFSTVGGESGSVNKLTFIEVININEPFTARTTDLPIRLAILVALLSSFTRKKAIGI